VRGEFGHVTLAELDFAATMQALATTTRRNLIAMGVRFV